MKKTIICLGAFLIAGKLTAQVDPHFSQFYAYPLWLNPGMTGVIDGDYRVTAIYRQQWGGISTPFSTAGVSADMTTGKNVNLGINLMNQFAGDGGYRYTNAYGTVAYSGIKWGPENTENIVIGIQAGLLNRRFDPSKFQFGDQWNPGTGYDPSVPTADILTKTSASVLDIGAGLTYHDATPGQQVNFYGGFSAFHLTQPRDPFIAGSNRGFLPVRYAVNAGAKINVTDVMSIVPNILYMRQGNAQEKMVGVFGQYEVNDQAQLFFGGSYRVNDAFSPFAGFGFRGLVVGMSYDVTTSDLGKLANGANSMEVSLTYTGTKPGRALKYLSCPRF